MACSNCAGGCGSSSNGKPAGCRSNGSCASGCNKLNSFDWLSNMALPTAEAFDVVEVKFKNGRKEFYRNDKHLPIATGEAVVVDVPNGHHLGHVSLQGELVRLQMKKKKVANDGKIRSIYRLANSRDLEKYEETRNRELPALFRTREVIKSMRLDMKLTDVEFQADNSKATFYYSADGRVDFRELIKALASEFRVRIEMRQISLRQEAGRLGGIGSCGRELCCSTWLTDFKSVSTAAARYQNLSLNPAKLSGQCGRLKCCLNYELDTYLSELNDVPKVDRPLETAKGRAHLQKTDIFRKLMWFSYENDNNWHALDVQRVQEIVALNKSGEKPEELTEAVEEEISLEESMTSLGVDLSALDKKLGGETRKKSKKRRSKKRPGNRPQNASSGGGQRPKSDSQKKDTAKQPQKPKPQGKARPKPKSDRKPPNKGGGGSPGKQDGGPPPAEGKGGPPKGNRRGRGRGGNRRGGGKGRPPGSGNSGPPSKPPSGS